MAAVTRILFVGAHKILLETELPRLRALGFEVFVPPNRSPSRAHQSLSHEWNHEQPTTLPPEVFECLSSHDFFSGTIIPSNVSALINDYFATVIVTSDPNWLISILVAYQGRVLFRVYGQVSVLSDFLASRDALRCVSERDNFWLVCHAEEAVVPEHHWLKRRMHVVPYVPSKRALELRHTWRLDGPHRPEIMVSCPNLENPWYRTHFTYLKKHFADAHFRFYGVQMGEVHDPQVVGTLPESEYFSSFQKVTGFLYTYREPTVCFLPPIEMMIAGGPVIFLAGSLLSRMLPTEAPGRCQDETEARAKCDRLLSGDANFAAAIVSSQSALVERFLPEHVWPRFDTAFAALLGDGGANRGVRAFALPEGGAVAWVVAANGFIGRDSEGRYATSDPQQSAVLRAVKELSSVGEVVVAVKRSELQDADGLFRQDNPNSMRVHLFATDAELPAQPTLAGETLATRARRRLQRRLMGLFQRVQPIRRLIRAINADARCQRVVVVDDQLARALRPRLRVEVVIAI